MRWNFNFALLMKYMLPGCLEHYHQSCYKSYNLTKTLHIFLSTIQTVFCPISEIGTTRYIISDYVSLCRAAHFNSAYYCNWPARARWATKKEKGVQAIHCPENDYHQQIMRKWQSAAGGWLWLATRCRHPHTQCTIFAFHWNS